MYVETNSPGSKALAELRARGKDFKQFEAIVKEFYQLYGMEFDEELPLPLTSINLATTALSDLPAWGYSDYLFMVNGTDEEVTLKDAKGNAVIFKPGAVHVFHFGEVMEDEA